MPSSGGQPCPNHGPTRHTPCEPTAPDTGLDGQGAGKARVPVRSEVHRKEPGHPRLDTGLIHTNLDGAGAESEAAAQGQ